MIQMKMILKNAIKLSLLVIVFSSCTNHAPQNFQHTLELKVQELKPVNREINEAFSATIRGKQDIDIRPQISGFVTGVKVDEGDVVKKGQVLFLIDQVQYQEAVNVAKANVAVAEANVETAQLTERNKKDLATQAVISEYDYQVAKNDLERNKSLLVLAQAQLISAEKNLSYTQVSSPSDGIIGKIPFRIGALVSPSMLQAMTTVSEYTSMYAYFSMTEKKLLSLSRNHNSSEDICKSMPKVELQLADGSMYKALGEIKTISGIIDQETGSVSVRAEFPNDERILRSGGTGQILMPYTLENCIVVPQSATFEIQEKKFIYTLDAQSAVRPTEIQIFPVNDGKEYIVTNGLQAGDKIVTEGISSLKDGMVIKEKLNE